MKISTLLYHKNKWSDVFPTDLDSENTWITVVSSPKRTDFSPLQELYRFFSKSKIIGCSSSGEIIGDQVYDNSLVVSICQFERTQIKTVAVKIETAAESRKVGCEIGNALNASNLSGVVIFADGLIMNGTELASGIGSIVNTEGKIIPVSGGLSGDGSDFKETFTIFNNEVSTRQVVAIGFYGNQIQVGNGTGGGWDAFGVSRKITKSKGNVLFELDGKPALILYKEYLGEQAKKLPASALLYPLAITDEKRKGLVRTILAVDEAAQSLTFAGDMPEGATAQLMKANFSRLVAGASAAGEAAITGSSQNSDPIFALAISCVGRRLVLGEEVEDETEAVLKNLPASAKILGFYSYGELSTNQNFGCELHNQTMTVTTFRELESPSVK